MKLAEQRNLFKLFLNDVGLLACQYSDGLQLKLLRGEMNVNYGGIFENAAAQEISRILRVRSPNAARELPLSLQ